jgi:hypothetical protein
MRSVETHGKRAGLLAATALAIVAAAFGASTANADILNPCGQTLTQPFLPWLDPASYAAVPGGDFESRAAGWTLRSGAQVVSGNESSYVHGSGDSYSLSLPAGSSATGAASCVGLLSPTTRLFVRNVGSPLGLLRVDLVYPNLLGQSVTAPIGLVSAGSAWAPTLPMLVLADLTVPPLVTNGMVAVSFRFTPVGVGAAFLIDDDYVDPYQGR